MRTYTQEEFDAYARGFRWAQARIVWPALILAMMGGAFAGYVVGLAIGAARS